VRESNIGNELKDVAQEVMRFGERCVQAGRHWLNERKDEMNNRNNDGRHDYGAGQQDLGREPRRQGSGQYRDQFGEPSGGLNQERGGRGMPGNRGRGEYYGGAQFGERTQAAGWDEEGGEWSYEGGPERFSTSGYSEGNLRASGGYQGDYSQSQRQTVGQYGRQPYGQGQGQDTYGLHRAPLGRERNQWGGSDYYPGRQGHGAQESFGSEYNTYGRNQGYGEGSGYTRQSAAFASSRDRYPGSRQQFNPAWRENAGFGGRGPQYGGQDYVDEGEMSGYRGTRELSTQEYGSRSSGRYGTEPGQYGYGGYGLGGRGYRGMGPKNYSRSDERLTEDLNERLTDDDDLDASEITVRVADGKVTLEGSVDQRWMKHRAEDIADACSGVREVDNRITVTQSASDLGASSKSGSRAGTRSSTGTTGTTAGTQPPQGSGSTGTH
jgi:hypothetical protein